MKLSPLYQVIHQFGDITLPEYIELKKKSTHESQCIKADARNILIDEVHKNPMVNCDLKSLKRKSNSKLLKMLKIRENIASE